MTETTRINVWEQIKTSELIGSDVVPLPIETVKLLLECARLVNEGASIKVTNRVQENILSDDELRYRCRNLARQL